MTALPIALSVAVPLAATNRKRAVMRPFCSKQELIDALKPFAEYGCVYGHRHDPQSDSVWDKVPDDKIALLGTCEQHSIHVGALREAARLYYANNGDPITAKNVS